MPLILSPIRALSLLGSCLLFPGAAAAAAQTAPALSSDYTEMVDLYAAGDPTAALGLLGGWPLVRIRRHTKDLSDAMASIRKCPACPTGLAFSRFPLKAALLLHADREIQEQLGLPVSEQIAECGRGPHATIIEHLSSILLLIEPKADGFLKPLYLAMARQAQWSHCFPQSQLWAHAWLKRFPRDGPLFMALGIAAESSAFFTMPLAPHPVNEPSSIARQRDMLALALHAKWESARRAYEDAITASPDLVEGHLRLGRVLWRLGRLEAARASLETALGRPAEANIQYLAHLFLGRVLEDNRQWSEAEEHYRTALSMQPLSRTAAVALSHVRFLQGDTASARVILRDGLDAQYRRTDYDPWVPYLITQTRDGEKILAELREALRP